MVRAYPIVICQVPKRPDKELDELFVHDVDELERLGRISPRSDYQHLQMSGILRRLACDEQPLIPHASKRSTIPAIVLVPEPRSGNPKFDPTYQIPPALRKYAPQLTEDQYPGGANGYFLCPYSVQDYLARPHMVLPAKHKDGQLKGRPISPREMILFLANKLGGVHADRNLKDLGDGGRSVDAETLYQINQHVSIYGQSSIFQQFGIVAERIWRCCGPMRDALAGRR
jgi:hypothetical protein